MTKAQVQSIVDKYGNDRIIGFYFDNSTREVFAPGTDVMSHFLEDDDELLKFDHKDIQDVGYSIIHLASTIYSVIVIDDVEDKNRIDARYVFK